MENRADIQDVEAIVVGSGFGGAVAACRLAQAGFNVLVLERGRRYGPDDFPELPADAALLPDVHRWAWQHDQGLWDVRDLEDVVAVQAAGYGGGSLIYANVHLRALPGVFDSGWPKEYKNGAVLEPYYDLAAYMLDVAPVDQHDFFPALVKADQLNRAATALKREAGFFLPPLTISREDEINAHGVRQNKCVACGSCVTGCRFRAKSSLDYNYLALAEQFGAHVRTLCEVRELVQHAEHWEVKAYDHTVDAMRVFRSKFVFLAAGTVGSTGLMARIAVAQPQVKQQLETIVGVGYFPGGGSLGMVYDTKHAQEPNFGPTIATSLVHQPEDDPSTFFMLQDGGYARELNRLLGVLRAPAWVGRNRATARGMGAVAASYDQEQALRRRPPLAPLQPGVPSGLDDILRAIAAGELRDVLPKQLRQAWPDVVPEISRAVVMRAIVERTIDTSIRERFRRCPLTRSFDPDRFPLKLLIAIKRWVIRLMVRLTFGGTDLLAERATYAMLTAGGLSGTEAATQIANYDAAGAANRTMLLGMGRDAALGVLNMKDGKLVADLDLHRLAPGYAKQEQVMSDIAKALGGELRVNPAWTFLGKPIAVHNQGGCRMSDSNATGVTDPDGKVYGLSGLYVCDGSLLCTSVGVNPSATILAIAERNVLKFIRDQKGQAWPEGDRSQGARAYADQQQQALRWGALNKTRFQLRPPPAASPQPESEPVGIVLVERMRGYFNETKVLPPAPHADDDAHYAQHAAQGRPQNPISLSLQLRATNLTTFFEDVHHELSVTGKLVVRLPNTKHEDSYTLHPSSKAQLFVRPRKQHAIANKFLSRRIAMRAVARSVPGYRTYRARRPEEGSQGTPRYIRYYLSFSDKQNQEWAFWGYKRVRNEPGPDAWRDTSSLYCCLFRLGSDEQRRKPVAHVYGVGVVHIDLEHFLFDQVGKLKVTGTEDPARRAWAIASFSTFFFGSLQRIYEPGGVTAVDAFVRAPHTKSGR